MRTIVAQWSESLKIPDNETFTLYYKGEDKILIDDIEKLKNVTLIKYSEDAWLSTYFFDIYKDACENGRLKGDGQLIIVTNEAYEGLKLPSQVIVRKTFPQNDALEVLTSQPPVGVKAPEIRVLWLIKDFLSDHTVKELEDGLGMSADAIIKMQSGGSLRSKDMAEKLFGQKKGYFTAYQTMTEAIDKKKKEEKIRSNKDFVAKANIQVSSLNAFLRGKRDLPKEEEDALKAYLGIAEKKSKKAPQSKKSKAVSDFEKNMPAPVSEDKEEYEREMLEKVKKLFPEKK